MDYWRKVMKAISEANARTAAEDIRPKLFEYEAQIDKSVHFGGSSPSLVFLSDISDIKLESVVPYINIVADKMFGNDISEADIQALDDALLLNDQFDIARYTIDVGDKKRFIYTPEDRGLVFKPQSVDLTYINMVDTIVLQEDESLLFDIDNFDEVELEELRMLDLI